MGVITSVIKGIASGVVEVIDIFADAYTTQCCGNCKYYKSECSTYGKCEKCSREVDWDDSCWCFVSRFIG